jgi:hypothetical protein
MGSQIRPWIGERVVTTLHLYSTKGVVLLHPKLCFVSPVTSFGMLCLLYRESMQMAFAAQFTATAISDKTMTIRTSEPGSVRFYPPLCVHVCRGSSAARRNPTHTRASSTMYTKFPPKTLFVTENAKSESAARGPIVHWTEATVRARPFTAPNDRLLGVAVLT